MVRTPNLQSFSGFGEDHLRGELKVLREFELIPDEEFLESEHRDAQAEASRELQLVLDPEFL